MDKEFNLKDEKCKQVIFNIKNKKNKNKNKNKNPLIELDLEYDENETKIDKKNKKRVVTEKWNLPIQYLQFEKQWELIQKIAILKTQETSTSDEVTITCEMKTLIRELERKIYGYKQQDLEKNIYDSTLFLSLKDILDKIINEKMKCFYCFCEMYVLYEIVRESKQWSVDRINNYLGHNKDNFVLACLECNLKRRRRSSDKYLFTKQLSIIKKD
jgi:hypothetical protein